MTHIARIFPPGLPIVHGPHLTDELAAWAARRIPHVGPSGFGPCWAVGVVRNRKLAAVVVYHDWQPSHGTVQLSAAADTPIWASRAIISGILGAAFDGTFGEPVNKVWTATPNDNKRALRFNDGIGFKREAYLRHHYGNKRHAIICSILAPEWRAKYGKRL